MSLADGRAALSQSRSQLQQPLLNLPLRILQKHLDLLRILALPTLRLQPQLPPELLPYFLQLRPGALLVDLQVIEVLEPSEELQMFVEEEAVAEW